MTTAPESDSRLMWKHGQTTQPETKALLLLDVTAEPHLGGRFFSEHFNFEMLYGVRAWKRNGRSPARKAAPGK